MSSHENPLGSEQPAQPEIGEPGAPLVSEVTADFLVRNVKGRDDTDRRVKFVRVGSKVFAAERSAENPLFHKDIIPKALESDQLREVVQTAQAQAASTGNLLRAKGVTTENEFGLQDAGLLLVDLKADDTLDFVMIGGESDVFGKADDRAQTVEALQQQLGPDVPIFTSNI